MQVQRKLLEGTLNTLMKAISSRPGIPALTGVLVRKTAPNGAPYGALRITATDLEWSITADLATRSDESFEMLVPARMFLEVVKAWDGPMFDFGPVLMKAKKGQPQETVAARLEYAEIRTLATEDFPTIEPFDPDRIPTFVAPARAFGEGLKIALKAASRDEARPILTGVHVIGGRPLDTKDKPKVEDESITYPLTLVATDSYRMHVVEVPEAMVNADFSTLISGKALATLATQLGKAGLGESVLGYADAEKFGFVPPDGSEWSGRRIVGEFPNWRQLMPDYAPSECFTITFDTGDLLRSLKQVGLLARESSPVKLATLDNGQVVLTASSPDMGKAERVVASSSWTGPEGGFVVAYNPTYLIEAITALDADSLVAKDGLKPSFVSRGDARALVMPVRLPVNIG